MRNNTRVLVLVMLVLVLSSVTTGTGRTRSSTCTSTKSGSTRRTLGVVGPQNAVPSILCTYTSIYSRDMKEGNWFHHVSLLIHNIIIMYNNILDIPTSLPR